jgi:DNA-binding NarL/FixJ family response regulator
MPPLRVLIVAGDPLVRAGLAAMLDDQPDCEIVGQISGAASQVDDLAIYEPDVVLWDLGWDVTVNTANRLPTDRLPILGLLPDESVSGVQLLAAGLRGLLRRDAPSDQIGSGLRAVADGLIVADERFLAALLPALGSEDSDDLILKEDLTPREMDVLERLAEGLSNRAIAQELSISEHTVKFHVTSIMGKLDAQSRTDAVVRATRLGLIFL